MCVRTDEAQRPPVAGVCFWPAEERAKAEMARRGDGKGQL